MFKVDLEKVEEPEVKFQDPLDHHIKQESSRKTSVSASLTMSKPLTVWKKKFFSEIEKRQTRLSNWTQLTLFWLSVFLPDFCPPHGNKFSITAHSALKIKVKIWIQKNMQCVGKTMSSLSLHIILYKAQQCSQYNGIVMLCWNSDAHLFSWHVAQSLASKRSHLNIFI